MLRLPSRSKYRAVRTTVDNIQFASKREAARYSELKLLEKAGEIRDLELQPRYELLVPLPADRPLAGKRLQCIGFYVADFCYSERQADQGGNSWIKVVEDVKGMATLPLAKWKMKHFSAEYGITVREIR